MLIIPIHTLPVVVTLAPIVLLRFPPLRRTVCMTFGQWVLNPRVTLSALLRDLLLMISILTLLAPAVESSESM